MISTLIQKISDWKRITNVDEKKKNSQQEYDVDTTLQYDFLMGQADSLPDVK